MKKVMSILLFVFPLLVLGQEKRDLELSSDELPTVVIKNAGDDFSVYLPDRNPDQKVRQLQDKFIGYNLGKNEEGFDEFLVLFEGEDASLAATYNEKGKLLRVVEKYENVKLPRKVIFSVYKEYPDWVIVQDKFLYTQKDGDILKKQYNLKIKKGKETKKIVVKPNGDLIADL
ncbi:hypothetical protein EQG63_11540 [Flavobacterium amnicola]|uniref:Nicotinate-nucleotide adenylyltransferase n=1 Tax=Flavobacterium amnicola TaxID=2506422 RepID=A0A4Q1K0M5_9FLAO|nr:hypothetical protein [Flavobacterium amnicola]RXR16252.1 hypothetical protein EQG63_11540 [Flavobacterium amnicola]